MQLSANAQSRLQVWHYTIGLHAEKILRYGIIQCATRYVPIHERPVVWFSMNQTFEPTAAKGKYVNGVMLRMSISEMFEFGRGLVRFGLPPKTLLSGDNLRRRARISGRDWILLKKSAGQMGADSSDWFGSLDPIEISSCTFEVMTNSGQWQRAEPSEWLLQATREHAGGCLTASGAEPQQPVCSPSVFGC